MTTRPISCAASRWYIARLFAALDHPGMIQSLNFRLGDSDAHVAPRQRGGPNSLSNLKNNARWNCAGASRITSTRAMAHACCASLRSRSLSKARCSMGMPNAYRLLAWCVMPTMSHALIGNLRRLSTWQRDPRLEIVHHHKANKLLGRKGNCGSADIGSYVRNAEHYQNVVAISKRTR